LNIDYLPPQGEFVALIAANSTKSIPQVFVAKVFRLPHDGKTAYLKEFSELKKVQAESGQKLQRGR